MIKDPRVYPGLPQLSILDCAKATGLNDRKLPHISNIGQLTIVQTRELSRSPKSKVETGKGIKLKRRYVALLEVMIAIALITLCALPLIYSQIIIIKSEKQFLDVVELDHAANLIYADILQKLYEGKIPLSDILNGKEMEIDKALLEQSGLSYTPFKGTWKFVLKLKKPPEPKEKELLLYWLILTFTEESKEKIENKIKYEYLVFIEHRIK